MQSHPSSHFRVPVKLSGRFRSTTNAAMIDSGATGLFLDTQYVKKHHMFTRPLQHQIKLYNIDGSSNSAGHITHSVRLLTSVDGNPPQLLEYLVTNLGTEDIILGLPWLRQVNPDINWKEGRIMVNTEGTSGMTIKDEPPDQPPKIDEHPISLPDPETDEDPINPEIPPSADPPLYQLNGN